MLSYLWLKLNAIFRHHGIPQLCPLCSTSHCPPTFYSSSSLLWLDGLFYPKHQYLWWAIPYECAGMADLPQFHHHSPYYHPEFSEVYISWWHQSWHVLQRQKTCSSSQLSLLQSQQFTLSSQYLPLLHSYNQNQCHHLLTILLPETSF